MLTYKTLKTFLDLIARTYHKKNANHSAEYKKALEDAYKAVENLKKFF